MFCLVFFLYRMGLFISLKFHDIWSFRVFHVRPWLDTYLTPWECSFETTEHLLNHFFMTFADELPWYWFYQQRCNESVFMTQIVPTHVKFELRHFPPPCGLNTSDVLKAVFFSKFWSLKIQITFVWKQAEQENLNFGKANSFFAFLLNWLWKEFGRMKRYSIFKTFYCQK